MTNSEFEDAAQEAGFSRKQIEFLTEHVAQYPHTHTMEEIIGAEETVAELVEAELADEEFPDEDEE